MKTLNIKHKSIISISIIIFSILYIGSKINNYNAKLINDKNDKYFDLGCISTKINNNLFSKPVIIVEKNRDYYLNHQHTQKSIIPTKQELTNDFNFIKYEINIINNKLENIILYKILFMFCTCIFTVALIYKILK